MSSYLAATAEKVVIVGGGAAGLELATRLGKEKSLEVTLIDYQRIHLWKPLLHEVATGTLDVGTEAVSYRAHSANKGYTFRMGKMSGINHEQKQVILEPLLDHHGKELLPERHVQYDTLVIAVGARSNHFGIQGVQEYCFNLDTSADAEEFHISFLNTFLRWSESRSSRPVNLTIVGGGATGVELSAEVFKALEQLKAYGVPGIGNHSLQVHLIEAAPRILQALPESMANKATRTLENLGVKIHTNVTVAEVQPGALLTKDGQVYETDMIVWAAGIKAPAFLSNLGLQTNRINQILIRPTLQTLDHDDIFVIGDCAFLKEKSGRIVPPRAQAAHQMAKVCARNILSNIREKDLEEYQYHDHGSLVTLSHFKTLGTLMDDVMDNLVHGKLVIEGRVARWAYLSLYRQHQMAVFGFWKTLGLMLISQFHKHLRPRLKLY